MRVVALTDLKGGLEAEAPFLATLLGLSAYDVRARFAGATPKILLQTPDEEVARRVQRDVAARGHGVVALDAASIVHTSQMVHLHRFSLDAAGVWASGAAGERLEWSDLGAMVVAQVRTPVSRTTEEVEYQAGTATTPSKVTHVITRTEQTASHVAYLFPSAQAVSQRPWVLEEASAQFMSLGRDMHPTRRANFFWTVAAIRRYAPNAVVDDRFVASPLVAQGVIYARGAESAPSSMAVTLVDLTVNILGAWLQRGRGGPYR
jgi:hypothetical protein